MATETTAAPPPPTAEPRPPAPPPDTETSKAIFKKARADLGLEKPPTEEPKPEPAKEEPAAPEPSASKVPDDVISPPEKTEEVKSEAVAEIEAAELPKNAKKEQIDSFNKIKGKSVKAITALEGQIKDLQHQIAGATNKTDVEELTRKLTTAEERAQQIEEQFSRVAFEHSPKFKSMFTDREQAVLDGAKKYLEGTEVRPELIEIAARESGKRRADLLRDAGVEPDILALIGGQLATYDTIQAEKKGALDNWQANAKQWQAEQQQQTDKAKAQKTELENRVWQDVTAKTDLLPLRKSKDNQEWNQRAETLRQRAKQLYNGDGGELPDYALTLLKGTAYDVQQEVIDHLKGRVQALESENASLKSATPGGIMTAQGGAQPEPAQPLSREEQAKKTFQEEKAKVGAR